MNIDKETVLKCVCHYFEVGPYEIFKKTRKREIVHMRHIFFHLCYKWTKLSLNNVGLISRNYGRPKPHDHASVMHSCNTIKKLYETDKKVEMDVDNLNKILKKISGKIMTVEERVQLSEIEQMDELIERMILLESQNRRLTTEVEHLKEKGLNEDEKKLLSIYRDLDYERKSQVMFKIVTTHKISQKLSA